MVIISFDHKDMKYLKAIQERVYVETFDSNSSDFKTNFNSQLQAGHSKGMTPLVLRVLSDLMC